jgi:16S rRNA (uracil1498-N3)-methyltransferase
MQHELAAFMNVRLYCDVPLAEGQHLTLPESAAHHARDVLRLETGATVTLLNGLGGEYTASLTLVSKKLVEADVLEFQQRDSEPPFQITVAQSLATGDKMDWVVEKAVELGAAAVVPIAAARSVLKLSAERAEKRAAHWQAIARAACEQCGRNRLAQIAPVTGLGAWLAAHRDDANAAPALKLMLSPVADVAFNAIAAPLPGSSIHLLIGPEAGLTDAEEALARTAGFQGITLGPRVMRTETAALAALAAIHARWGDF